MVGGAVYLFITQRPWRFQGDMATLVLGPSALFCLWSTLALPKPLLPLFLLLSFHSVFGISVFLCLQTGETLEKFCHFV